MITVLVLASVVVAFLAFGVLVVRDVFRQTADRPEPRWSPADDARVARLLDAGRR
jgi:hypothetical protein